MLQQIMMNYPIRLQDAENCSHSTLLAYATSFKRAMLCAIHRHITCISYKICFHLVTATHFHNVNKRLEFNLNEIKSQDSVSVKAYSWILAANCKIMTFDRKRKSSSKQKHTDGRPFVRFLFHFWLSTFGPIAEFRQNTSELQHAAVASSFWGAKPRPMKMK